MNIFKEMGLAVYSFKSYKEFLNNRKSKVFLFGVVLMLFYFLLTMVVPFFQMNGLGLSSAIQEVVPDFELKDGVLWVDDVIELDDGDTCIWIDTNPDEVFYEVEDLASYYYSYSQVLLMDSEKMIVKSNGAMQQYYFDELDLEYSKADLMALVPSIYVIIVIFMIIAYIFMTGLFFFGVLFVALIGMIVASCMKYQLTFGQLYLLGVYSRVLPLAIKAAVSFLPFNIPYFWVINFGLSIFILVRAIQHLKESMIQQPLEFHSSNDTVDWMR